MALFDNVSPEEFLLFVQNDTQGFSNARYQPEDTVSLYTIMWLVDTSVWYFV